ncbi:hypothetical protein C6A87_014605 [Mycobacterium sp. ITM-2016-00317]|uniref:hypothetical protein n=1 Tax=Mycobacterium sp. ITM-2016-00317 TaxID=2099694 RepID=UPI000D3F84F0|nr:hypothetical protein [Mycobacterium sp. ITM-2016-00317]WNG85207.1 hypothetical protein C6A87_014605 [Mycobacterium sp. ITM-2016-00317]
MRSVIPALLVGTALLGTACSGPTVVNTDDAARAPATPAPTVTTTRPSNVHLADAHDYAAEVDGRTGYYFTSPSGRWECAILPRVRAGCQNAQNAARIGIGPAPDEVPGADGEPGPPTAVVVDRTADPHFVALEPREFGLEARPAAVLPFNRVLAAAGFRCNVQEAVGISCLSELSGKGFTFSSDSYTASYTDVPVDAP